MPIAKAVSPVAIQQAEVCAMPIDSAEAESLDVHPPLTWSDLRREAQKMNADIGKIVSPNGIDEAGYIIIGGVRQWVTVRGQDRSLPILVYFHGGPGGAVADISYSFQRPWEDYFTVVHWDQRGFGRSAVEKDSLKGTINNDQYVSDAIDLIEQLRARFQQPKVIVMGQSWGSALGLQVARKRPDLLYALVTVGLLTAWDENFEETRRLLMDLARREGDDILLCKMTELGPRPTDGNEAIELWLATIGAEMTARGYSWRNSLGPWHERMVALAKLSPTVSDEDLAAQADPDPNGLAYFREIRESLRGWTVEEAIGTRLEVPLIAMQGDWDWQTPTTLARAYFDTVDAPWKLWVPFHNSAHVVVAEEPGKMTVTLVNKVLPAVTGGRPQDAEARAGPR